MKLREIHLRILIGRLVYYVLLMVFALMINKSAETIWIANVVVREPKKHNLSLQRKAILIVLKIKTTNNTQYNIWLCEARMLCFFCIHKVDGPAPITRASPFSRRRQNPSVISAPLCKFRKYSPTDWAQNQSLVSITTFRYSKIHHL